MVITVMQFLGNIVLCICQTLAINLPPEV